MISASGTAPYVRESVEFNGLSPSSQTWPSGTLYVFRPPHLSRASMQSGPTAMTRLHTVLAGSVGERQITTSPGRARRHSFVKWSVMKTCPRLREQ